MKKTYMMPELLVTQLKTSDVITYSPYSISINESGDGDIDYLDFVFS